MTNLKKNVEEILEEGYFSYQTIEGFGWGSHIDSSRGGLVIEMKNRGNVIAYMNADETGFILAYDYDFSDQEERDVNDLLEWIAE